MKIPTPRNTPQEQIPAIVPEMVNSPDAKELIEHWFKTPPTGLKNMFYTYFEKDNSFYNQRAVSYELPASALKHLLNVYRKEDPADCELKVYMGCNSNYTQDKIMEGAPGFSPVMQLNIKGKATPNDPYPNCYVPIWRQYSTTPLTNRQYPNPKEKTSQVVNIRNNPFVQANVSNANDSGNPSQISFKSAHLFMEEWCMAKGAEIEDLFTGIVDGRVSRINSFTFLKDDLIAINKLSKENPNRSIHLHLAVIKPNTISPFGFHVVLEVGTFANTEEMNVDGGDSTFFEYAFPCPPICVGAGG